MAAAEQSMMDITIENENDGEREQEPFAEPTMMCLDDFQGDGQDNAEGDSQDNGQGDDQGDGQDDGQGDGQDDGQGDGDDEDDDESDGEANCQAKRFRPERSAMQERRLRGDINEVWIPLDRREVFFNFARPYQLVPLSRYFFREWSEAEHLFMSALQYEEEDDWYPSRDPTIRNVGL